jgi:hypothetical protein
MFGEHAARLVGAAIGVTRALDTRARVDETRWSADAAIGVRRAVRRAITIFTRRAGRAVCRHAARDAFGARSITKAMCPAAVRVRSATDAFAECRVAKLAVTCRAIGVRCAFDADSARRADVIRRAVGGSGARLRALAADRVADVSAAAVGARDALHADALRAANGLVFAAVCGGGTRAARARKEPRAARTTGRSQPKSRAERKEGRLPPARAHWHCPFATSHVGLSAGHCEFLLQSSHLCVLSKQPGLLGSLQSVSSKHSTHV